MRASPVVTESSQNIFFSKFLTSIFFSFIFKIVVLYTCNRTYNNCCKLFGPFFVKHCYFFFSPVRNMYSFHFTDRFHVLVKCFRVFMSIKFHHFPSAFTFPIGLNIFRFDFSNYREMIFFLIL